MEYMQIFEDISSILKEKYGKNNVNFDTGLTNGENSLDLDSLEIVRLIIQIEEKYNIIIDLDILFKTVDDIVSEVYKKLNQTEVSEWFRNIYYYFWKKGGGNMSLKEFSDKVINNGGIIIMGHCGNHKTTSANTGCC